MTLEQTIRQHVEKLPLPLQGEVLDYVLYLEQKNLSVTVAESERRQSLSGALERAVALNPFAEVDPLAWQREQRSDDCLPGRE